MLEGRSSDVHNCNAFVAVNVDWSPSTVGYTRPHASNPIATCDTFGSSYTPLPPRLAGLISRSLVLSKRPRYSRSTTNSTFPSNQFTQLLLTMSDFQKEPGNVVRGLEAAMNNPNVSEETKNRDAARIEEMGEDYSGPYRDSSVGGPDKNYSGPSTRTRLQEGEPVAKETMRNIKKANDIVESSLFKDGKQPLDSDERIY
ncbi:hypothetical protein NMY22_g11773 [Coprinellus aureogranulatus]|nr:hypothetical protein NMY22_g11773 [Coprinellus aureogranulatus]